ncbi:MAG: TetR/AcrR family transcriptional regulator [Oscillospiraceae bacterium]|nr:TetR/AcrR family transcriptional regulator [Oscillospiraceae bacterium]
MIRPTVGLKGTKTMRISKDADVRKAEILDAAEKLFQEKGYAKATTDDILSATGIARGSISENCGGKNAIRC